MGLFDKIDNARFVKEDNELEYQLKELKKMRMLASGKSAEAIDTQIRYTEYGLAGEKKVRFELENSHIPMFVIHDLCLEYDNLKAQIDYVIITRKHKYIVECKNLYGDIEIDENGNFYRVLAEKKEGFYSPVTQNERHRDLLRKIGQANKGRVFKALSDKLTENVYKSIVVLSNPRTVLKDKNAPKEIRDKVIRADQLIRYIKETDAKGTYTFSETDMSEYAEFLMKAHIVKKDDGLSRFREMIKEQENNVEDPGIVKKDKTRPENATDERTVVCPKCGSPMVLRTAMRGANAGNKFWGCSKFPKCRGSINI